MRSPDMLKGVRSSSACMPEVARKAAERYVMRRCQLFAF